MVKALAEIFIDKIDEEKSYPGSSNRPAALFGLSQKWKKKASSFSEATEEKKSKKKRTSKKKKTSTTSSSDAAMKKKKKNKKAKESSSASPDVSRSQQKNISEEKVVQEAWLIHIVRGCTKETQEDGSLHHSGAVVHKFRG